MINPLGCTEAVLRNPPIVAASPSHICDALSDICDVFIHCMIWFSCFLSVTFTDYLCHYLQTILYIVLSVTFTDYLCRYSFISSRVKLCNVDD